MHFFFLLLGVVEKVIEKAGKADIVEKVIDKAEKVIASSNDKKRERQSSSSSSSSSDSEGAKEHNEVPNTIIIIQNENMKVVKARRLAKLGLRDSPARREGDSEGSRAASGSTGNEKSYFRHE